MDKKITNVPGRLHNVALDAQGNPQELAGANEIMDDALGKMQNQINAEQVEKNSQTDAAIKNRYNKGETDALISAETARATTAEENLRQLYNSLSQSQPIPVTSLPATGVEGKIYRLAGESSYADYMWNGTQFIKMAKYDNAIDDELTAESNNLVKSKGIFKSQLVESDITDFSLLGRWSCDDSSYAELTLDETGYNGTFYLKKKGVPRLYLNCSSLTNDTLYRISLDFDTSNGKQLSTFGKGETQSASWSNLHSIYGRTNIPTSIGHIDFTFKKESTFNYIFVAFNAADLTFPMTATVSNFRIAKVNNVTEQAKRNAVNIAENYNLSKYTGFDYVDDVTSLMRVWASNVIDVFEWQVSDEEIVIKNNVKTINSYCGFCVESIPNGTLLELKFKSIGGIKTSSVFAKKLDINVLESWRSLVDIKGITVKRDYNGYIYLIFEKTSDFNWIVIASNSFDAGAIVKLTNYSLKTVVQNKKLSDRVEQLEINYKYPVTISIIPPNYTWEKYMDLQGTFTTGSGQGSCVYEDIFVNAATSNSRGELQIKMYDLVSKQLIQAITLTGITNVRTHSNSISFGNKYDESDPLPLLYISSGYILEGTTNGQVYVYRFTGTIGNLNAVLIQIITLVDVNSWTEWVCDADNNRAWVKIGRNKYICYTIPSPQAGDVDIDESTPILEEFVLPTITLPQGVTNSSNQGFVYNKGRLWLTSGGWTGEGTYARYISAINTRSKCRECVVWLVDIGFVDTTQVVYEPEGIFIWNNKLYIPFHDFIAKIKKVDLV